MGNVFQNAADQLFNLSCREEVAFGPYRLGLRGEQLRERVEAALARAHLQGFADKVPLNMSGGERKCLAVAAALAMEPEMLILDEPTAALDPQGEELLLAILRDLQLTTLLISHDLFFIGELTERTVVIHRGVIFRDYRTGEFLSYDLFILSMPLTTAIRLSAGGASWLCREQYPTDFFPNRLG